MGGRIIPQEAISLKGEFWVTLTHVFTGKEIVHHYKNIIVSIAKTMIAQRLGGAGNNCEISFAAVGTDNTTPVSGDTALGNEYFRKQLTTVSYSGNTVTWSIFFATTEANASLKELGLFGEDASETPNSGTMVNHAAIDEEKTSSYTMSITGKIYIN